MKQIYLTVNRLNGKVYVGQKALGAPASYMGGGRLIKQAMRKYGRDAFRHIVLLTCEDHMADDYERLYIHWYDSIDRGYNLESGGHLLKSHSDASRRLMSEMASGREFSPDHRAALSRAKTGTRRSRDSVERSRANRVYRHTREARDRISKAQLGASHRLSRVVVQMLDDIEIARYVGGTALRESGFSQSKVSAVALGKRKKYKGFSWKYLDER